jgi:hypothetical protein
VTQTHQPLIGLCAIKKSIREWLQWLKNCQLLCNSFCEFTMQTDWSLFVGCLAQW